MKYLYHDNSGKTPALRNATNVISDRCIILVDSNGWFAERCDKIAVKRYLSERMTDRITKIKMENAKLMVELYLRLLKSKTYKSLKLHLRSIFLSELKFFLKTGVK